MKALKPIDAALGQFRQRVAIARDDAAPQGEVGDATPFERVALGVELAAFDRARRRVQRHVEEQRAAARRQRAAAGGRAFPLGAARLVEVHVDVDQARQDGESAGIDLFGRAGQLRARWPRCVPSSMAISAASDAARA